MKERPKPQEARPVLHVIHPTDVSAADLLRLGMGSTYRALLHAFDRDFDVHYYTQDADDLSVALGVRHHPLGPPANWPKILRWAVFNLRLVIASSGMRGPVRVLGPNLPVLPLIRRRTGGPLVVDFGYDWAETSRRHYSGWKRRLARPVQRNGLAAADLVLPATEELARAARRQGARRTICIPNFVDPGIFHPREPRRPIVLFAGRLHWAKGVDVLIRAHQAARANHPGLELHLFGDGEEAVRLRALAASEGASGITFHGSHPQEDVAVMLGHARVSALPTLTSEGMPKGILEALASGTPIVGTTVSGIEGLVDSTNGILVAPGDAAALAAAIDRLMSDPGEWERLSRGCLSRAPFCFEARVLRHQRRVMRILAARCAAAAPPRRGAGGPKRREGLRTGDA